MCEKYGLKIYQTCWYHIDIFRKEYKILKFCLLGKTARVTGILNAEKG